MSKKGRSIKSLMLVLVAILFVGCVGTQPSEREQSHNDFKCDNCKKSVSILTLVGKRVICDKCLASNE